jgi:hypothetical protein
MKRVGKGHWGELFIVDKPFKNMLKPEIARPLRRRKGFFVRWV